MHERYEENLRNFTWSICTFYDELKEKKKLFNEIKPRHVRVNFFHLRVKVQLVKIDGVVGVRILYYKSVLLYVISHTLYF